MRKRKDKPKRGDFRVREKFLLMPRNFEGDYRWFEKAHLKEEFRSDYAGWKEVGFADEDEIQIANGNLAGWGILLFMGGICSAGLVAEFLGGTYLFLPSFAVIFGAGLILGAMANRNTLRIAYTVEVDALPLSKETIDYIEDVSKKTQEGLELSEPKVYEDRTPRKGDTLSGSEIQKLLASARKVQEVYGKDAIHPQDGLDESVRESIRDLHSAEIRLR